MRRTIRAQTTNEFAADVRAGLTKVGQKELLSKYFYDDLGTALFEAITLLPEYGLTRADLRLLDAHSAELAKRASDVSVMAELGSGSGNKARVLLPHFVKTKSLTYCPIDVSSAALLRSQRDVADIQHLTTVPIHDSYVKGLASASKLRKPGTSMLVVFLGSSIGNFDPVPSMRFLEAVRRNLKRRDIVLLSCDLIKSPERMLAAYDDALGVTAAFNLNLLSRINRELEGNFNLARFRHEARFNEKDQRIEMHLRSLADQIVSVDGTLRVTLKKDETIWTESSYKFRPDQIISMAKAAGLACEIQWTDSEWPFAQSVFRAD
jgi:L-histidine Nalpha-methyltransferase